MIWRDRYHQVTVKNVWHVVVPEQSKGYLTEQVVEGHTRASILFSNNFLKLNCLTGQLNRGGPVQHLSYAYLPAKACRHECSGDAGTQGKAAVRRIISSPGPLSLVTVIAPLGIFIKCGGTSPIIKNVENISQQYSEK